MRLNRYLAYRYGASRRKADEAIANNEVYVNSSLAHIGQEIDITNDVVTWPGHDKVSVKPIVVMLHKPIGYVSGRDGQGSPSLYELLPDKYSHLKIAGRLDKDSSGLVVLTNDGQLLQDLTHPSNNKTKKYQVRINQPLKPDHRNEIIFGVDIGDQRPSRFLIEPTGHTDDTYMVEIQEGRNRQIRRTLEALGYTVTDLHRTSIGDYQLENLEQGQHAEL